MNNNLKEPHYNDENTRFDKYISEQESLSKYQLLFNKSNDIIFFSDIKGNIIEANEAAVKEYGYTKEEFEKLTIFELRKNKAIFTDHENLDNMWKSDKLFNTIHFRKDGSSIPVEVSWSRVNIAGEPVILHIVRVVTKLSKYIEDLENKNKELHNVMEELTKTKNQLFQQEKLAAIGQLSAGIAHEINNPLGFIMSNLSTLEKYSIKLKEVIDKYHFLKEVLQNDDIKRYSHEISQITELEDRYNIDFVIKDLKALLDDTNDGLNRIKKIVTGLRNFSRSSDEDKQIEYDINDGIENTLAIANNEIKYFADVEKNLGHISLVTLSCNQVNQVLLNIIINAVYAIRLRKDGQRGLIKISTYNEDKYVCCEIEDNGVGIPNENLSKIFEPFFTTKPEGKGTGLGLSISYDIIVNRLCGKLLVKSTVGKGTAFTIKLPI